MNGTPIHEENVKQLVFERAAKDEKLQRLAKELRDYWKSQDYPPEMVVHGVTPDANAMAEAIKENALEHMINMLKHNIALLESMKG